MLRAAVLLPLPVLVALGNVFGQLLYFLASGRREVSRINLRIAFPELCDKEIRKLNRAGFRNVAIGVLELGLAWWESERVLAMCEIEGLEHLREARGRGKGVILLTAHFTCLEIGGPVLNRYVPLEVMYKRPHNELLDAYMVKARAAYSASTMSHHKPLALLKGLKKGHAMWYAPDQDFGAKDTVFVPLFGVEATALTAPARIAKISGAPVVPYFIRRKPRGGGYRLTILPPLENFPLDDAHADAGVINDVIERLIMKNPEQYLWLHRRYKYRPDGRKGMYPPFVERDSATR